MLRGEYKPSSAVDARTEIKFLLNMFTWASLKGPTATTVLKNSRVFWVQKMTSVTIDYLLA